MKNSKKNVLVVVFILVIVVTGFLVWKLWRDDARDASDIPQEEISSDVVVYKGKKYRLNSELQMILFIGVDKSEPVSVKNNAGLGGQSDTLILAILNQETKKAKLLEISRDTMTDIKIYDDSGEYLSTEKAQVALQYAYGTNAKRSSQLAKEAVSHILYEIPIRQYISLNVDGIAPIVDAIGGVRLTIPQDYTVIDPAFEARKEVTLNGEQAESYVRYRDHSVVGSNTLRMERQNDFLLALMRQMNAAGVNGTDGYSKFLESAGEYLDTNLTADELKKLSEYEFDSDSEIFTLPGEMIRGEKHDEYHLEDEKVYEMVLKLFYKPIES